MFKYLPKAKDGILESTSGFSLKAKFKNSAENTKKKISD